MTRLNDEGRVSIESGYSATQYANAVRLKMLEYHNLLTGRDDARSETLAKLFLSVYSSVDTMLKLFDEDQHELGLLKMTEGYETRAAIAREKVGRDWNPDYTTTDLTPEEITLAFEILIARDFRTVLDQIEIDRMEL